MELPITPFEVLEELSAFGIAVRVVAPKICNRMRVENIRKLLLLNTNNYN